jgi:hypothetical protein
MIYTQYYVHASKQIATQHTTGGGGGTWSVLNEAPAVVVLVVHAVLLLLVLGAPEPAPLRACTAYVGGKGGRKGTHWIL